MSQKSDDRLAAEADFHHDIATPLMILEFAFGALAEDLAAAQVVDPKIQKNLDKCRTALQKITSLTTARRALVKRDRSELSGPK